MTVRFRFRLHLCLCLRLPLRHFYCRPSLSADCLSDDSLSVRLSLFIRLSPFRRRSATSGHSNCSDCCPAALQPLSGYSGRSDCCPAALQPLSGHSNRSPASSGRSGCSSHCPAALSAVWPIWPCPSGPSPDISVVGLVCPISPVCSWSSVPWPLCSIVIRLSAVISDRCLLQRMFKSTHTLLVLVHLHLRITASHSATFSRILSSPFAAHHRFDLPYILPLCPFINFFADIVITYHASTPSRTLPPSFVANCTLAHCHFLSRTLM